MFGCAALGSYSSEEMARIAAQCRARTYHVFEDMNYLETVAADGSSTSGVGEVVATNLHNFAMPLIRYAQGDLGRLGEVGCDCGWKFRTLHDLQGRKNDAFVMPSGRVLSSGFLLDATYDFVLEPRASVRDFRLIQESTASIRLEIVPGKGWSDAAARRIESRFQNLLEPGVEIRVQTVAACERTQSGKGNPIVRRTTVS